MIDTTKFATGLGFTGVLARLAAAARAGFEADWHRLLAEIPDSAFEEYRDDRETRAEIRAKRPRGEKLDSEIPSSMMQCACGIRFDSHVLAANLVHLPHIYAAQAECRRW